MTLSGFKSWLLDYKLRFVDGRNNPELIAMMIVIREKLASVEDSPNSEHCVKCENCSKVFLQ